MEEPAHRCTCLSPCAPMSSTEEMLWERDKWINDWQKAKHPSCAAAPPASLQGSKTNQRLESGDTNRSANIAWWSKENLSNKGKYFINYIFSFFFSPFHSLSKFSASPPNFTIGNENRKSLLNIFFISVIWFSSLVYMSCGCISHRSWHISLWNAP